MPSIKVAEKGRIFRPIVIQQQLPLIFIALLLDSCEVLDERKIANN